MPITKSAKKALRQSKRKQAQNTKRKNAFRVLVKKFRKAVVAKEFDKAKELLPKVYKALDKAAKGKTIKDALKITREQIAEKLGGMPKEKIHCSVLAAAGLRKAVADYRGETFKEDLEEEEHAHC